MEVRDEFQLFEDAANSVQGILRGEVGHKVSLKTSGSAGAVDSWTVSRVQCKQSRMEQIISKADFVYLCYLKHSQISNELLPFALTINFGHYLAPRVSLR